MKYSTNLWSIDIETVSQGKRADEFTSTQEVKLGNVKDPEKIKAKLEDAQAAAKSKHGLYWWTGKVICVCMVHIDNPENRIAIHGLDESTILQRLAPFLGRSVSLIGQHAKLFDYGFLVGRYLANGLPVPSALRSFEKYDLPDLFGYGSQCSQRPSLSELAHGLCIDGKLMKGSHVQSIYDQIVMCTDEGEREKLWAQIIAYCYRDNDIVVETVRRYFGEEIINIHKAVVSSDSGSVSPF